MVVATLALVFYGTGALNDLERQGIDVRFSLRGDHSPGDDIVIVGIDQSTLETLGTRPPLPRAAYAQVLDRIRAGSPRVIGIDTQFIGRSDPATTPRCSARLPATGQSCWPRTTVRKD